MKKLAMPDSEFYEKLTEVLSPVLSVKKRRIFDSLKYSSQ